MQNQLSIGAPQAATSIQQWTEIVGERVMRLHITSPRDRFRANLAQRRIGAMEAFFIRAEEQYVARPRRVSVDDEHRFFLMQTRETGHTVEQCGRETTLGPGECMLLDSRHPFRFAFPSGANNLLLSVPTSLLRTLTPHPEKVAGRRIAASGWSGALCAMLANITPGVLDELAVPRELIGEQVLGLFSLAATEGPERERALEGRLLHRIRQIMAERCTEPGLGPQAVADGIGISVRYLHAQFAKAGTTFGAELIGLRLQRASRLLQDQRFRPLGIAEIGWRCGFRDPSHFARRFRARFGCPPRLFPPVTEVRP